MESLDWMVMIVDDDEQQTGSHRLRTATLIV